MRYVQQKLLAYTTTPWQQILLACTTTPSQQILLACTTTPWQQILLACTTTPWQQILLACTTTPWQQILLAGTTTPWQQISGETKWATKPIGREAQQTGEAWRLWTGLWCMLNGRAPPVLSRLWWGRSTIGDIIQWWLGDNIYWCRSRACLIKLSLS